MNASLKESPRKDLMPLKPTRRGTLYLQPDLLLELAKNANASEVRTFPADTCPVMPYRHCSCAPRVLDCDGTSCRSFSGSMLQEENHQQALSTIHNEEDIICAHGNEQRGHEKKILVRKSPPRRHHSAPSSPRRDKSHICTTKRIPQNRSHDLTSSEHGPRRNPSRDTRRCQSHRRSDMLRRCHSSKGSLSSCSSSSSNKSKRITRANGAPKRNLHRRWESARSLDLDLETIEESELSSDEMMRTSGSFSSSLKYGKTKSNRRRVVGRSRSPMNMIVARKA